MMKSLIAHSNKNVMFKLQISILYTDCKRLFLKKKKETFIAIYIFQCS